MESLMRPEQVEPESSPPDRTDSRAHGRFLQQSLVCSLGRVLDMSATGMRVLCSQEAEGQVSFTLRSALGQFVSLRAQVVWCRRLAWRKYEAGLRFLDMSPQDSLQLSRIAMEHRPLVTRL
jgi:hypothetical protein